jgi:hypothetical protein
MAAEDEPPVSDSPPEDDDNENEPDCVVHERVPVGPIENLGSELGALVTRVSDRRDLLEDEREYQAVEFADVEAAVEERREDIIITETADLFLEMAMNTDQTADSNIADKAQETVTAVLERESPDSLHVDRADAPDTSSESGTADTAHESVPTAAGGGDDVDNEELLENALEEIKD